MLNGEVSFLSLKIITPGRKMLGKKHFKMQFLRYAKKKYHNPKTPIHHAKLMNRKIIKILLILLCDNINCVMLVTKTQ